MGAVTYPNPEVEKFIHENFVPVQFNVAEDPGAMERFNSIWTPTIIVQDAEGKEHRRTQGYLDPPRFLAEMSLARVQAALDQQNFAVAEKNADEARGFTRGDPNREPEALYWHAVAKYKRDDDKNALSQGWNQLLDRFPQSEWAKKAEFIRQ
jgi:TolA-binding protein